MAMQKGKINLVIDGQWGSVGKGKVAGYLALRDNPDVAVCNFMTNAGHWFRSKVIGDFLVQQIPIAAVNRKTTLLVAANSVITIPTLLKEIKQFEDAGIPVNGRLFIDPHAAVITDADVAEEKAMLVRISSTTKGCGAAQARKIKRDPTARLAKDCVELRPYLGDVATLLQIALEQGATVLGELAQGFDLSLNHGFSYPHVTSRDVTPMSFMSDIGVPTKYLGDVYGVLRTYPIRVGQVYDAEGNVIGDSGPHYADQEELTWEEVARRAGKPELAPERTTVTNKIRRVFTFSRTQYQKFIRFCDPNKIVLNFCNYFPGVDEKSGAIAQGEYAGYVFNIIDDEWGGIEIAMLGTGADNSAMIDLERI